MLQFGLVKLQESTQEADPSLVRLAHPSEMLKEVLELRLENFLAIVAYLTGSNLGGCIAFNAQLSLLVNSHSQTFIFVRLQTNRFVSFSQPFILEVASQSKYLFEQHILVSHQELKGFLQFDSLKHFMLFR